MATLLGAFTLEALGLSLDPLRRELKQLPMILAMIISLQKNNISGKWILCH